MKNFFRFLGALTLPIRFPLAVVSSVVVLPTLAVTNFAAVTFGTVAIRNFNRADTRNLDPDYFGLIDFSKSAFRGLVKFGTYPVPEGINYVDKFINGGDYAIEALNKNALKAVGIKDFVRADFADKDTEEKKPFDFATSDKKAKLPTEEAKTELMPEETKSTSWSSKVRESKPSERHK